ncbi:MAG: rhomboid family intramembrane serine protease [Planctomycetes bacterium]|nr:rhomboid family intramembrane serine protease [Planctomycetota bacterium]
MGIQDRDYYRNEGPSAFDSLLPSGLVCRWLIAINVIAWLLQVATQSNPGQASWFTDWFILDVNKVLEGEVWRLLTFAFLHDPDLGSLHLIFNMLFLWWFGSDIEQLYGRREFLVIYLVSAVLGGIAYTGWGVLQTAVRPCLGASGAVTTMLVLCALHFPRRIIYVFLVLPMPIWLFAVLNVARDAFYWFSQRDTGVAVVVHLAGAAFGLAYYKWQGSFTGMFHGMLWWQSARSRPRLKLYRPDPHKEEPVAVSANSAPSASVDEHLEAKLDAVLEKIARWGKGSLTQQDEEVLKQAAEMYKRRRT